MSVFNIKKDGAYQEPEAVKKKPGTAWEEAEFARRIIDGAWQDVWVNELVLDMIAKTITTGEGGFSSEWENGATFITVKNDGGYATFATDGVYSNPTLSFLYEGSCYTGSAEVPSGTIYAYGVKADGTEDVVEVVSDVNTDATGKQQATYTFTGGAYTRVGFRFQYANWGLTQGAPYYYVNINTVTIDGKKCVFDPNDTFNFN